MVYKQKIASLMLLTKCEGCVCLNNVPFRTKQRLVIGSRLEMSREEHILKLSQDPCVV